MQGPVFPSADDKSKFPTVAAVKFWTRCNKRRSPKVVLQALLLTVFHLCLYVAFEWKMNN